MSPKSLIQYGITFFSANFIITEYVCVFANGFIHILEEENN